MTKDEALKMAIETMKIWNGKSVKTNTASFRIDFEGAIQTCKEALEQPITRDWKETVDERIAKDDEFKRALEQPSVAELNDEYLRDTYVQGLSQPAQEPVAWMHRHAGEITEFNDFQACQYCEPLYTHPAPSWQGLSDDDFKDTSWFTDEFIEGANWAQNKLKEKNNG